MIWRRIVALIVLMLACALAQAQQLAPIPPLTSPVVDTTGTIDAATRQKLEAQALALQQRKGSQLQVLVVPTTQPEDIAQYGVRAFEQWKIGRKGVDDGLIVIVAKDDRRVRIEVGYGLEGAIPDATSARVIQEYMVPKFRAGDYAGGISDATGVLVKLIDGEPLPAPLADHRSERRGRGGSNGVFAVFVAFIVAQVARGLVAIAGIQLVRTVRLPAAARGEPRGGDEVVEADHRLHLVPAARQQHVAVMLQRGHREHALDGFHARPLDREAERVQAEGCERRDVLVVQAVLVDAGARRFLELGRLDVFQQPGIARDVVAFGLVARDGGAPQEAFGEWSARGCGIRGACGGRQQRGAGERRAQSQQGAAACIVFLVIHLVSLVVVVA